MDKNVNKKDTAIFTVVIPIHNSEDTIERTLASLISSKDYISEVLIVNDDCTDNTLDKVELFNGFYPIRIVSNNIRPHSPSVSRRVGLLQCKSKYITFVDSDDCLSSSSLKYVYEQLKDIDCLVMHCKTAYYESGYFNKDNIEFSDNSCGGNFYKTSYLLGNKLLFHYDLYMCEDEYFNERVDMFIRYCDKKNDFSILYYDYPVYEVHHDTGKLSLALSNWVDYCIKWHLLYKQFLTEDFIKYFESDEKLFKMFEDNYIDSFIFCYFMSQCLSMDIDSDYKFEENKEHFIRALKYYKKIFNGDSDFILSYYKKNRDKVNALMQGAIESTGIEIKNRSYLYFKLFINKLNVK